MFTHVKVGLKSVLFLALVLFVQNGFAKAMPQRLGIGIKNNTQESLPSLAVLYNVNNDFAVFGGFGVDTQEDNSRTQINAGVRHIIFHEAHMHFYTAGQAGLVTYETPLNEKESGLEAHFVFGTEFFFPNLENLGFSFEAGVGFSTVDSSRVFTIADHPLKAGLLFYF